MDSVQQLEFDKLREILSSYCFSQPARDKSLALQPLADRRVVNERGELISECQELLRQGVYFNFSDLEDIDDLLFHFEFQAYNFTEFKKITLAAEKTLLVLSNEASFDGTPRIKCLTADLTPLPHICKRFVAIFSPEGEVLDTASPALKELRRRQNGIKKSILDSLNSKLQDKKYESVIQDKIITQRDGRYVIPLKDGAIGSMPGIIHGFSGSRASIFVEPNDVVIKNNELNTLKQEESEEIYRICCEFTQQIKSEGKSLSESCKTLIELDFLFGAARFSNILNAAKPIITETGIINLQNARHPLLIVKNGSISSVIPFNLSLGENHRFFILSGPNTGGKTVTLKAVGLISLMALSGLPIPASQESKIGMFNQVFADIGDDQSLENSLSTFSAHIERIKGMLGAKEEKILVLIDEIGAATDPEQGAALAQAIIEVLLKRNAIGIVTTHFTTLKLFAEQSPHCINAAMQFDNSRHIPTYQFQSGLPGNSFAIEIADKLGLDTEIIVRAKELAGKANIELTDLISKINTEKKDLAQQKYQYELKNRLLEMKVSELEKSLSSFELDKKNIRREAVKKAQDFLTDIQREINQELEILKTTEKDEKKKSAARILNKATAKISELNVLDDELTDTASMVKIVNPKVGDKVWVREFEDNGEIASIENNTAKVVINGLFFTTDTANLYKAAKQKAVKKAPFTHESKEVKTELKLLGLTFDETIPLLTAFIDEGYNAGLNRLRIVHGKGTGALRSKIRQYLRSLRIVEEFFSPAQEAGGDGVTVIVFRSDK